MRPSPHRVSTQRSCHAKALQMTASISGEIDKSRCSSPLPHYQVLHSSKLLSLHSPLLPHPSPFNPNTPSHTTHPHGTCTHPQSDLTQNYTNNTRCRKTRGTRTKIRANTMLYTRPRGKLRGRTTLDRWRVGCARCRCRGRAWA